MRPSRWKQHTALTVAILAPAAALRHVGISGTWRWIEALLPSLHVPDFHSYTGLPGGPPGLKAAWLLARLGEGLLGHAACTVSLLIILTIPLWPISPPSRAQQRLNAIALLSLIVSSAAFSTWVIAATLGLQAQDF